MPKSNNLLASGLIEDAYERGKADDGYATAFYELAKLMGVGASPYSPEQVWRNEMLPRLRAALALPAYERGKAEGIEAAATVAEELASEWDDQWRKGLKSSPHLEGKSDGGYEIADAIRALALPA